jgi:hypothetical protein
MDETQTYEYQFERRFVERIMEIVEERNLKLKDFAALIWAGRKPESLDTKRMLISIRKPAPRTGKFQALKLREACRMAEILGEDLAHLVWEVERDLDARGLRKVKGGLVASDTMMPHGTKKKEK